MTSRAAATSKAITIAIAFALAAAGCGAKTTTIEAGGDAAAQTSAPAQTDAPGQTSGPEELSSAAEMLDEDNIFTTTTAPPEPPDEQASPTATILDPDSPITTFAIEDGGDSDIADDDNADGDAGQDTGPVYTGDPDSKYCEAARQFEEDLGDIGETYEDMKAWLVSTLRNLKDLEAIAPSEIQTEFAAPIKTFAEMLVLSEENESLEAWYESLDDSPVQDQDEPFDPIGSYNSQVCNMGW